jgi:hypothetical protein
MTEKILTFLGNFGNIITAIIFFLGFALFWKCLFDGILLMSGVVPDNPKAPGRIPRAYRGGIKRGQTLLKKNKPNSMMQSKLSSSI